MLILSESRRIKNVKDNKVSFSYINSEKDIIFIRQVKKCQRICKRRTIMR